MKKRMAMLGLLAVLFPVASQARDFTLSPRDEIWSNMALRDYAPLGMTVPAGSMFYPSLTVVETFDDNIYRRQGNVISDWITSVQPAARLQSDWNRHALRLAASGDLGFYADNDSENYEDVMLDADGRVDVLYDTYFSGGVHYAKLHDDRGSPNDNRGDSPTEFSRISGDIGFTRELGRLKLFTNARHEQWTFDDNSLGGVVIDNSFRDREQQSYMAKLAYELTPGYDAFVRYTYRVRKYETFRPDKSDSDGYDAVVGTAISLTSTLEGEVYAGYYTQKYEQNFEDANYVNFGGALNWAITPLTAIRLDVYRDVRPTNIISATDYVETSYSATVIQALRRNITADVTFRYIQDEFIVAPGFPDAEDKVKALRVGMGYLLNRNLSVRGSYDYIDRSSDNVFSNYDNNIFSVSLKVAY